MKSFEAFVVSCTSYRLGDLKTPRIIKPQMMDLPYHSSVHFINDSVNILYPDEHFVKQIVKGGIKYIYNVTTLKNQANIMGRSNVTITSLSNQIKREISYLKPCNDVVKTQRNESVIIFYNYSLLTPTVRYNRKITTPYAKWRNLRITLWDNVNNAINETGAIQIIPFNLPEYMPSYEEYIKIDKSEIIPIPRLKIWSNEEMLDMQDLIRFFGYNRKYSNLNLVEQGNLDKVILRFKLINENAVYFSLGLLDSYLKKDATKEDEDNYDEKSNGAIPPISMQRRILQLIRYMVSYNQKILEDLESSEDKETVQIDETKSTDVSMTTSEEELEKKETVADKINRLRLEKMDIKSNKIVNDTPQVDFGDIEDLLKQNEESEQQINKLNKEKDIFDLLLKEDEEDEDGNILHMLNKATKGKIISENDKDIQLEDEDDEESNIAQDDELVFNEKTISKLPTPVDSKTIIIDTKVPDIEKGVVTSALKLMRKGVITGNEASRLAKLAKSYKTIPNPFNKNETLEDLANVGIDQLSNLKPAEIPSLITVPNKALLDSVLPNFEKVYIKKYLNRQIAKSILGLQSSGIAITDYNVEVIKNASDEYQHITLAVTPPLGKTTNLHIKVPIIREDGTYKSNGSIFRLRNQRADVPIRKINADEVSLASYYGKLHINRGRRQSINFDIKLYQAIKKAKNSQPSNNLDVSYTNGDVFIIGKNYPRDYSGLSKHFVDLTLDGKYVFVFDQTKLHDLLNEIGINFTLDEFIVGYNKETRQLIMMRDNGSIYCSDGEQPEFSTIGEYILGKGEGKLPKDQAFIEIYGASIPIGLVLSYYYGLHNLLSITGIDYDITRERKSPSKNTGVIKFTDCYLSYDANHKCATIFNSLSACAKVLNERLFMELEDQDNYNRLFSLCGFNIGHLNEVAVLQNLFIDPITKDRLEMMGEPTEFKKLLIRAAEMLKTDYYLHSNDFNEQVIRGYERIPGLIYEQIAKSVRGYYARTQSRRSKVALDNYAVWNSITNDPTIIQTENLNPIHNLKEKESVTFTGTGGRKKDTMTRPTRVFLDTDKGIISDATKDSSDVGIEAIMVASPKIKNFYGFTERFNDKTDNAANLLSTTALLYPYADVDDCNISIVFL